MTEGGIAAFWHWFAEVAAHAATDPTDERFVAELDRRVGELGCPAWEIGPGESAEWFLALSPGRDASRLVFTHEVVRCAPELAAWEFLAARPRKRWELQFEVAGAEGPRAVDARAWEYIVYRFPDGRHDVVVLIPAEPPLSDHDRALVAQIAVEGQLGEELLLAAGVEVEAVSRWSEAQRSHARPLPALAPSALKPPLT